MARGKLLLGLDIGSSAVRICQLREKKGRVFLSAFDTITLPEDTIVDSSILNRNEVVESIKTLLQRNKITQKQCAIAIAGYSVIIKRIRLPLMTDEELDANLPWEVEHNIPFDIKDVLVDRVVLSRSTNASNMDILLVASKKDIVNDYLSVAREAGLQPKVVDIEALALQNVCEYAYGEQSIGQRTAIIDIGKSFTTMTLIADGLTAFTRDLNIGGDKITKEIQKHLNITKQEAENIKITGNTQNLSQQQIQTLELTRRQVCEDIAKEINRSLHFFYESTGERRIDLLLLTGGVANDQVFINILEETTSLSVSLADPFRFIEVDPFDTSQEYLDNIASISAIAIGLALRRTQES